jgi:hypothetical protein
MVITGYFDESGTHGGSEVTVMAGFLGDVRQWHKFEKRSAKLFSRFRVDVFHTVDIKRTDGDFVGWSVDRKIEFIDEFHHIINETLERGFAAILRTDVYDYYSKLLWPKKARKESKYCILFRAIAAAAIDTPVQVPHWEHGDEAWLNIVLESGHPNAGDALRLYNLSKERFVSAKALAGLTFVSKKDCLPLAAADLFAYNAYGIEIGAKPVGQSKGPIKAEASYPGHMYRIVLKRETMDALHQQSIEQSSIFRRSD